MKRNETILAVVSLVLTIIGLLLLDLGPIIRFLANTSGVDLNNINSALAWIELFFRITIFLFVILLILLIDLTTYRKRLFWYRKEVLCEGEDVAEYMKEHNESINRITIFGYSMSFAEPIRIYLEQLP